VILAAKSNYFSELLGIIILTKLSITRMQKIFLMIFILTSMSSCQKSESIKFEKNGVSFTCPTGWKIESEDETNKEFTVTIQKDGLTSSGTIKIYCLKDSLENMKALEALQKNFKKSYSDLNISFSNISKSTYNNISCISSSFEFDWMGDMEQGTRYVLHGKNKTISILIQEAAKHSEINKNGFAAFENSFSVH
jgi:hypothetical protein